MASASPAANRAKATDQEFDALYRHEFAFVWRMLRFHGVGEAAIEDAVQDVFLVVHRRWSDWRRDSRERVPRAWLFSCVRRVAASQRRKQARHERKIAAASAHGSDAPIDDGITDRAVLRDLMRVLEGMEELNRTVFVLAEIEGMTAPEIAELLGAKPNTIYWRLRTARAHVAQAMAADGSER
jgi:RNA polymerase sigma factor (sigma-70 family)